MTYSSWVGKGLQQKSIININPISKEAAIAAKKAAEEEQLNSAAGVPVELNKEPINLEQKQCPSKYPAALVGCLGAIIVCLMDQIFMVPLTLCFN